MKVEIKINPNVEETIVTIETEEISEEVQGLLDKLKSSNKKPITGKKDNKIYILNPQEINYFFSEKQKIYANSDSAIYEISGRLYEIEEQFKDTSFIKISKSVIANVDKIKNLEMSFNGTMCVNFKNGAQEFISRKYVSSMKNYLSMGGK